LKRLFINYRQSDTKPTAHSLHRDLKQRLAPDQMFLDEHDIQGGEEWPTRLRTELAAAHVVFALIGPGWLSAENPDSKQRRLDEPGDWVRRELEEALKRRKTNSITLVPVRVDNANKPESAHLPESLRDLPSIQAEDLRNGKDWDHDVDKLVQLLLSHGFTALAPIQPLPPPPLPQPEPPLPQPAPEDLRQQIESEEACRAILSHRACCWAASVAQLFCLVGAL
jgi:hypothetical protein